MIWLAAVFAPLAAALALGFGRTRALAADVLAPFAALPALGLALTLEAGESARFGWLLLGTQFGVDATGRVLFALTALLWLAAGASARSYLAADPRRVRFYAFFAVAMCGNLGLVAAQDVISFYAFFALMTFSAYGLVVHSATKEALRAGRIYLLSAIFGEVLLLAALMLVAAEMADLSLAGARAAVAASGSRDLIVALAYCGFGVKAGAALVHFWLPLAHPVAPVPASAVLSGAMIKAGLIGWLHFLPLGVAGYPAWGYALVIAGYAAAYGAVVIGLTQREPKTVLAYSSVSQMGLITAVLGAALADAQAWPLASPAIAAFALNHGLAKGALFLGVGVMHHASSPRVRALVTAGLGLAALAIAGAPWTAGALAKTIAKDALAPLDAGLAGWLALALSLSSVATTLLLARFIALVREEKGAGSLPAGLWLPWALLVACALAAAPALAWLGSDTAGAALDEWAASWPVAAGLALYALLARVPRGFGYTLPPGDMVVLLERAVRALERVVQRIPIPGPAAWQIDFVRYVEALAATEARRDLSRRIEMRATRWNNAALAFVAVVLALALMVLP